MALGMAVALLGERLPLGEGLLQWLFPLVAVLMGMSLLDLLPLRLSGFPGSRFNDLSAFWTDLQ